MDVYRILKTFLDCNKTDLPHQISLKEEIIQKKYGCIDFLQNKNRRVKGM